MPWPRKRAREHLESLAAKHDIVIHWITGDPIDPGYEVALSTRQVWVSKPTSLVRYLSALHEFGHVLDPHAFKAWHNPDVRDVVCEAHAWQWAIEHALPETLAHATPDEMVEIGFMWASYLPWPSS